MTYGSSASTACQASCGVGQLPGSNPLPVEPAAEVPKPVEELVTEPEPEVPKPVEELATEPEPEVPKPVEELATEPEPEVPKPVEELTAILDVLVGRMHTTPDDPEVPDPHCWDDELTLCDELDVEIPVVALATLVPGS